MNLPANGDLDAFEAKISEVRAARGIGEAEYADALRDLLQFDYDSRSSSEAYDTSVLDSLVKKDRFLDARGLAKVRGFLHNKNRSGAAPKAMSETRAEASSSYRDKMPRIGGTISALGGDWEIEGAQALSQRLFTEFRDEFSKQGAHVREAEYRANRKVIQILNERSSDPTKAYIAISSKNENATINLYMDGSATDGTLTPMANEKIISEIRSGLLSARALKFNKDSLTVNVLSNSSSAVPNSVASQLDKGDIAFTFQSGNGIYIYPEKVENYLKDFSRDPNWFSTDVTDSASAYKHLIVHESGHLQMYKNWGTRAQLASDFTKFKVKKDGTSIYGDESVSESFAEQYAKYLLSGNASPEFLELLSSKGMTKAQLNKKWRENHPDLQRSKLFTFLEGVLSDDQAGVVPEFNGPEAAEYQQYKKYGAGRVHKLARILGFASNKPTTVATINDDKYVVYRGVNAAGANLTETAWGYHNNMRTADLPYYGYGVYGDGQYTSTKRETADSFGSDAIAKMRVKPDAKVYSDGGRGSNNLFDASTSNDGYDINEIATSFFSSGGFLDEFILNEIDPDLDPAELKVEKRKLFQKMGLTFGVGDSNLAIIAAMLGFQGYEVSRGSGESYIVVLDRGMLEMTAPPGFED